MTNDLSQYRDLYIQTARDLLNNMKTYCNNLESNNSDEKAVEELHRAAHSLKSQSLVMGYPQMGLLNKQLEALFLMIKEHRINLDDSISESVKRALTSISFSLDQIENKHEEGDLKHQIEEIEHITHISS